MSYKTYTAPEYYKHFLCKCGKCRNTCCGGWGISLTMSEYYRLIGLDCSSELRQKLDCAFYRSDNPSPERFALINRRFDGKFPLQREDGLCGIQKECGEDVISSVCRYYPRSIKNTAPPECCCSSSCEAVIELLLKIKTPLRFEKLSIEFEIPDDELSEEHAEEKYKYEKLINMHFNPEVINNIIGKSTILRNTSVKIMQNRNIPISSRFSLLRHFFSEIDLMFMHAGNIANKPEKEKNPAEHSDSQSLKNVCDMFADEHSETVNNFPAGINGKFSKTKIKRLSDTAKLINLFSKHSQSIMELAASAFKSLNVSFDEKENPVISDDVINKYMHAETVFKEYIDPEEIIYEQIIVNNMFYSRFPVGNITETELLHNNRLFENRAHGLEALYYMLRLITLSAAQEEYNKSAEKMQIINAFTDCAASLFRMVEHTSFLQNCLYFLSREELFEQ